jgi:hypothetical protein
MTRPSRPDLTMALPRPDPAVVCCEVEDGAVLLSTADEVYYGLNRVGLRIWQLLPPVHRQLDELCDAVARDYPDADRDELRADVEALLSDLLAAKLLVRPAAA